MTTNIDLQRWLARFPDDTAIKVMTTRHHRGSWHDNIDVYEDDLNLNDLEVNPIWAGHKMYPTYALSYNYDKDGEISTCKEILFGYNDD